MSRDGAELEERCYAEFVRRNPFNDWTFPTHALTRGVRVRASVAGVTGDAVMEGLPRQLALVSTDLVSRTRQVPGAVRCWTPPSPRCGCPCCSRRYRPTTGGC